MVHLCSHLLPPLAVANHRFSLRLSPLVDYQVIFSTDRKLIEKCYCDMIVCKIYYVVSLNEC